MQVVGRLLVGKRQRVGEHQASLGIGIADLDGLAGAALEDVARPEGVAGDAVLGGGDQHAQAHVELWPMIMCASASAVAAPPMSFFISSMALDGLMSRPPVSKQMPLPMMRHLRRAGAAPGESIRRGARGLARPTAWMSGKFFGEQCLADDGTDRRAVALGEHCGPRPRARRAPCHWPAC